MATVKKRQLAKAKGLMDRSTRQASAPDPAKAGGGRASKAWMRTLVLGLVVALAVGGGIGTGSFLTDPDNKPGEAFAFYLTDAPAKVSAFEVSIASVKADGSPLQVTAPRFDLAAHRGPDQALLVAKGRAPADAVVEVVFGSATAVIDGQAHAVQVPSPLTLTRVDGAAMLVDIDIPDSLGIDDDGALVFAPRVAAVMSAPAADDAPAWTPVAAEGLAAGAAAAGLRPAGIETASPEDVIAADAGEGAPGSVPSSLPEDGGGESLAEAPTGWLVTYRDDVAASQRHRAAIDVGATVMGSLQALPVSHIVATPSQAATLAGDPRVAHIEPEAPITYHDAEARLALRMPDLMDPVTGLRDVGGSPVDGAGIGVAVVDSGIDGTHPAFSDGLLGDSVVVENRKVVSAAFVPLENTDSTSGHGTHVAAIVAGQGEADLQGIAPGARLYGLGIGEASTTVWAAQAFDWILAYHDEVDPPIRVVTNSWSTGTTYDPDSAVTRLVARMVDEGIVVVFSAGNSGGDGSQAQTSGQCRIPTPGVICVAAYDDMGNGTRQGQVAWYSSRGAADDPTTWPDVSAPGTDVMSARPLAGTVTGAGTSLYVERSGTSQAAPHVAGVAALLLQVDGSLSPAAVEAALKGTAHPLDAHRAAQGDGLVDAYAAVDHVASSPTTAVA